MTQKEQVLKHLKRYAGLTTLTAYDRYAITRLAARVSELRADGYEIASIPKDVVNRYGEKCRVAEYRLVK